MLRLSDKNVSQWIDFTGKTCDKLRELIKDFISPKAKGEESIEGLESLILDLNWT